jgi:hypothetical protein
MYEELGRKTNVNDWVIDMASPARGRLGRADWRLIYSGSWNLGD